MGMARWMVGAGLALSLTVGAAAAQVATGGAVKDRQAHFLQQGAAFKALLDELKKDQPDPAVISGNAAKLKSLSIELPTWFPAGSGPATGVKTEAKAEVWSEPSEFAQAAQRFQAEAAKLDQLAMAGDLAGVKAEAGMVGGACKNCHDQFRAPPAKT
jgi:cytochrome c556